VLAPRNFFPGKATLSIGRTTALEVGLAHEGVPFSHSTPGFFQEKSGPETVALWFLFFSWMAFAPEED